MSQSLREKVAIYLPSLGGGGAERVTVTLANAFAARGLAVDLVLPNANGPYRSQVNPAIKIVDLNASRVLASAPRLVAYLRRERPASLLSVMNHANVVAVAAKALAGVRTRVIVSEHNTLSSSIGNGLSLNDHVHLGLMKLCYRIADGVVGVSDGVSDDLARCIRLPRDRITTIYNPIDAHQISLRSQVMVEHPWFAPGAPPVIVGIGRLTEQKNFKLLLDAFARLRSNRSGEVRLIILGEGELRGDLERQVEALGLKDVSLPGFVSNPYAYARASAVFVLSSAWEGLPTVLIEAMACGVRVVSTNCPSGPSEILEDGKWGRLVPTNDVAALADAMDAALNDSAPPAVSDRAMDFSVNRSVDAYLRILGMGAGR
jgi:glycosyltransferase involved in cell wall biosynthesis